jgi:hypothetical protein
VGERKNKTRRKRRKEKIERDGKRYRKHVYSTRPFCSPLLLPKKLHCGNTTAVTAKSHTIFFNIAVLTVSRFWSLPMEWRDVEHRILLPYPHGLVTYDEYTLCRKWREGQSKLSYC